MKPWLLDRRGEAPLCEGCRLIENEVDLLDAFLCAANSTNEGVTESATNEAFHVRGASLCDWAQRACRARGWECEERQSPIDDLLALSPDLSRKNAALIYDEMRRSSTRSSQPMFLSDTLHALHPDFAWHAEPSLAHAASWLLWRDAAKIALHHHELVEAQVAQWRFRHTATDALYVATSEETTARLRQWLHLESGAQPHWGAFAQDVPPRWMQQVNHFFAQTLTRDGAAAWMTWRQKMWPSEVLQSLAQQTVRYLETHAPEISPTLLVSLQNTLSLSDYGRLQKLSPPPIPSEMPSKTDAILRWVTHQYLPFRRWQAEHGDHAAHETVERLAQGFARWYLGWYSSALMGLEETRLATRQARELRDSDESSVVLWVIADGLGWLDAQRLQALVTQRSARLSIARNTPVFAPVPTITHFCKRAVRWGMTPRDAMNSANTTASARRETEISGRHESSSRLRDAKPGDIVIWKPEEPDATYHKVADRSLTHDDVEGALISLANQIVKAITQVPDNRVAKVVITTDHGRLLGRSRRRHAVPNGFEAHGRTAYRIDGTATTETHFDEDGVSWHPDLAWLDAERFGLPTECVIALDDSSFLTNSMDGNGRGGSEEFPHGGVFPEEVVIPWIEIERDAATIELTARATGSARTGTRGVIKIGVENPNAVALRIQRFIVVFGNNEYSIVCEETLAPWSTATFETALESWPTKAESKNLKAWLEVLRADKKTFKTEAQCELKVEEMQSREYELDEDMR